MVEGGSYLVPAKHWCAQGCGDGLRSVAAIVLLITDRLLEGFRVAGFVGALIVAVAIGIVHSLLGWLMVILLG